LAGGQDKAAAAWEASVITSPLRERFYDLAEQRARWVRGVGGAGVGAVPLDILAAYFLILFDTDL
jgi:hypothetical protein